MRVRGGLALVRRDLLLFASYRYRLLTQPLQVLTTVTLFYYVSRLITVPGVGGPDTYFATVVVGITILDTLSSTLATLPTVLRAELVAGTFERLILSPLGARAGILGMLVFPFLSSLFFGMITLAIAAIGFGMPIEWDTAWLFPFLALAGVFAFAPFSVLITAAVLVVKQVGAAASFVLTGISLVGGFFFPVNLLPPVIQWMAEVQPFTPALDILRHVMIGTALQAPLLAQIAKIFGFTVVLMPLSAWTLKWAIEYAQRRGTIIEY